MNYKNSKVKIKGWRESRGFTWRKEGRRQNNDDDKQEKGKGDREDFEYENKRGFIISTVVPFLQMAMWSNPPNLYWVIGH